MIDLSKELAADTAARRKLAELGVEVTPNAFATLLASGTDFSDRDALAAFVEAMREDVAVGHILGPGWNEDFCAATDAYMGYLYNSFGEAACIEVGRAISGKKELSETEIWKALKN